MLVEADPDITCHEAIQNASKNRLQEACATAQKQTKYNSVDMHQGLTALFVECFGSAPYIESTSEGPGRNLVKYIQYVLLSVSVGLSIQDSESPLCCSQWGYMVNISSSGNWNCFLHWFSANTITRAFPTMNTKGFSHPLRCVSSIPNFTSGWAPKKQLKTWLWSSLMRLTVFPNGEGISNLHMQKSAS